MLYRYFVSNQIKDGGTGMENPNATVDGKELVKFSWKINSNISSDNFDLNFYIEDETPKVNGFFYDKNELINLDSIALTWSKWFELQSIIAQTNFSEYKASDDSKITIIWNIDGKEDTNQFDGSNQNDLKDKVINIINEAYNQ